MRNRVVRRGRKRERQKKVLEYWKKTLNELDTKIEIFFVTVLFILLFCGDVRKWMNEINQSILTNGIVKVEMAKTN